MLVYFIVYNYPIEANIVPGYSVVLYLKDDVLTLDRFRPHVELDRAVRVTNAFCFCFVFCPVAIRRLVLDGTDDGGREGGRERERERETETETEAEAERQREAEREREKSKNKTKAKRHFTLIVVRFCQ